MLMFISQIPARKSVKYSPEEVKLPSYFSSEQDFRVKFFDNYSPTFLGHWGRYFLNHSRDSFTYQMAHNYARKNPHSSTAFALQEILNKSLFQCALTGRVEQAKECLALGASVHFKQESFGNTTLHMAVLAGYPELVKILLENKANPDTENKLFTNPIQCNFYATSINQDIITDIFNNYSKDKLVKN